MSKETIENAVRLMPCWIRTRYVGELKVADKYSTDKEGNAHKVYERLFWDISEAKAIMDGATHHE